MSDITAGELGSDVEELRTDLAITRAQRDGLQRALDKANRDNDALRARLRQLGVEPGPTAATVSKLLVDRGEGDYTWIE